MTFWAGRDEAEGYRRGGGRVHDVQRRAADAHRDTPGLRAARGRERVHAGAHDLTGLLPIFNSIRVQTRDLRMRSHRCFLTGILPIPVA